MSHPGAGILRDTALAGRTAIITGGSRGIGLATAHALVRAGAHVVITSRQQATAESAAAQLGPHAIGFQAHALDEDAAQACLQLARERFGGLDILINNAGTNPAYGPLIEQQAEPFAKTFAVNVWAPLLWTRTAVRLGLAERGGTVVNVASVGALVTEPGIGVYNASKAALVHLTRQLAIELAPGIRVNAVAPGIVKTELARKLWEGHESDLSTTTPLARLASPVDVAAVIAFLATEQARWITGQALVVDGGQTLGDASAFR